MKTMIILSLLVIMSSSVFSQKLTEDKIKISLSQIFNLSKENNFDGLAEKLLAKREKRALSNSKADLKQVKRTAKKIKAYLELSDSYEYQSLKFDKYEDLPSADLKVTFKSGDQDLNIAFTFVELSGKILLVKFR